MFPGETSEDFSESQEISFVPVSIKPLESLWFCRSGMTSKGAALLLEDPVSILQ